MSGEAGEKGREMREICAAVEEREVIAGTEEDGGKCERRQERLEREEKEVRERCICDRGKNRTE